MSFVLISSPIDEPGLDTLEVIAVADTLEGAQGEAQQIEEDHSGGEEVELVWADEPAHAWGQGPGVTTRWACEIGGLVYEVREV